jgi:hypothetical protein
MWVISMSDQAFNAFGERVVSGGDDRRPEQASRFLARFGVTLFWVLAIAIVSARIFARV